MAPNPLPLRGARLLRRAAQWVRLGEIGAAERAIAEARALAPDHPQVLRAEAALQLRQQRPLQAVASLERAAALDPADASLQVQLGRALRDAGDFAAALAALQKACELAPDFAPAWFNLGTQLFMATRAEEARAAFERAHALAPTHVPTLMGFAETLKTLGFPDLAAEQLRAAIRLDPSMAHAWQSLTNLKTIELSVAEVNQLERVYRHAGLADPARAIAGFALGTAFERQHRYPEAHSVFVDANAMQRRRIDWNPAWFSSVIDATIEAFSPPQTEAADCGLGREVIFIVSLPRSGSTLTEQILATHPEVEGADELRELAIVIEEESQRRGAGYPDWVAAATPADWERLGHRYLERTASWRRSKPRFTDKGLSNWQLIGAARAMLPAAKIVHCRRDPVETCWSCFKQLFPVGQPFSYDLGDMAAFWHDYDRLMRFWRARFPDRLHELDYADLVAHPQAQIRRLLDYCDLPFDPACMNFHQTDRNVRTPSAAQVRQPLRTDTALTGHYGQLLDPLRRALQPHTSIALR
jgi:Tfp pilus assembly protein PilF